MKLRSIMCLVSIIISMAFASNTQEFDDSGYIYIVSDTEMQKIRVRLSSMLGNLSGNSHANIIKALTLLDSNLPEVLCLLKSQPISFQDIWEATEQDLYTKISETLMMLGGKADIMEEEKPNPVSLLLYCKPKLQPHKNNVWLGLRKRTKYIS